MESKLKYITAALVAIVVCVFALCIATLRGGRQGQKLTVFAEETAANTYALSVTYTPANTTFQKTTFTADWQNPSSTWASGKAVADYVKVTPTGDTTSTLEVLQQFSEQIIVTATCNRNTAIKATTTVDFLARPTVSPNKTSYGKNTSIYISGTVGVGTLQADLITASFVLDFGETLQSLLAENGFILQDRYFTNSIQLNNSKTNIGSFMSLAAQACNVLTSDTNYSAFKSVISKFVNSGDGGKQIIKYGCIYQRQYNGVDYSFSDKSTACNNSILIGA